MTHFGKLLLLFFLANTVLQGQNISQKIDSIAKSRYQKSGIGMSIGFIKDDTEYYTSYGTLNKESDVAINKNSVFEIASITKVITSVLMAQAVLENKIQLDDFIDNYIPEGYLLQNSLKNKIRISDLASHQSGLPDIDFRELITQNPQQPISSVTQRTLHALVNSCDSLQDYGTYRYSTLGYALQGQILEVLYKTSYDSLVEKKLIRPLQLINTLTRDFKIPNRTHGYNSDGGQQEFFHWNVTAPAGLLKSSASDMVTYLKAILNEDSRISEAARLTETAVYSDSRRTMGLGLQIVEDGGNTLYLKSGDSMGQSSMLCYNREHNWGLIILLNHRNSQLRQELLNAIYEVALKNIK